MEVNIWRTLVGYIALTPESFGFAFCATPAEKSKLRSDLEAGVPMAQAVGFSGSHCSLQSLVKVESKKGSPTILLVARDFLGKAKEDFTFERQGDREIFYRTLLRLLGPGWKCKEVTGSGWLRLLLVIAGTAFGVLNVFCGGVMLALPATPEQKPEALLVFAGILVFGVVVILLSWALNLVMRKLGQTTWETICKG